MPETVPADIAAAIYEVILTQQAFGMDGHGSHAAKLSIDAADALDELNAAILHHLRGYAEMKAALERIEQGV